MRKLGAYCLWILVAISTWMVGSTGYAAIISYKEDPNLFGTLDQKDTNCPKVNCGPTAAVNSLVYLQNMFSKVYKTPLVPHASGEQPTMAQQAAVANTIGTKFMKNCCATSAEGTDFGDFVLGLMDYIESVVKGVTKYAAQILYKWAGDHPKHPDVAKPAFVQDFTAPTLAFIASQLKAKADVEILVQNGPSIHYLTLTSISYNDATNKGSFTYVDPLGGKRGIAEILGPVSLRFDGVYFDQIDTNYDPKSGSWVIARAGRIGGIGWHEHRTERSGGSPCG